MSPQPDPDSNRQHIDHPVLNRFLILIRPGPAYIDWADSFGDMDASSLEEEFTAYLVPPLYSDSPGDALDFLEPYWRTIADEEFASWCLNAADWPDLSSLDDFGRFFDWDITDLVIDLCAGPRKVAEESLYEYRFRRIDGPPCADFIHTESKAKYPIHYVEASSLETAVAQFAMEEDARPDSDIGPVVDRDGYRWVMVDSVPIRSEHAGDPSLN